ADLHRAPGAGSPAHAAPGLLRRLQPRAAFGQARHAGQSAQGLAPAQPRRDRAMSELMNDAAGPNDALAAEYVLGTLDPDERAQARELLATDRDFEAKVIAWERRLGELHLMVELVDPEPGIWERIKAKLPEVRPLTESRLPQAPQLPNVTVAPAESPPAIPD